jgi:hypothetical protein
MKRIIYILWAFILMFALCGVVSSAEEASVDEAPEVVDDETVEVAPPVEETVIETPAEDEHETVFTRLYEWFTESKTDVFTLGGSAVLFALSLILKRDMGSTAKKTIDGISRVLSKADVSDEKQNAIVGGLNEMVDGYNEIKNQSEEVKICIAEVTSQIATVTQSNASLEAKIDNVFNVILSLMDKEIMQNAEVMEVLSSVYANNKALPQGIKDFVALKRSENAKLVQEAAILVHKDEGGTVNE